MQALGGLEDLLSRLEPSVQSLLTASITDPALMDRLKPFQGMAQGLSQLSAALSSIRTLVNEQADTVRKRVLSYSFTMLVRPAICVWLSFDPLD